MNHHNLSPLKIKMSPSKGTISTGSESSSNHIIFFREKCEFWWKYPLLTEQMDIKKSPVMPPPEKKRETSRLIGSTPMVRQHYTPVDHDSLMKYAEVETFGPKWWTFGGWWVSKDKLLGPPCWVFGWFVWESGTCWRCFLSTCHVDPRQKSHVLGFFVHVCNVVYDIEVEVGGG